VDSKIRSQVGYFHWALAAQSSERTAPYDRPGTGAYLIIISALSLGIWAAIWGAVASLASVALG
jgi:hypothetical protein